MKSRTTGISAVVGLLTAVIAPGASNAQDIMLDAVVITAQRRAENQQDVPIAIASFTSARLDVAAATTTLDLASITPGLSMPTSVGRVTPRIRGIGTTASGPSAENPVAVYIDEV